MLHQIYNIMEKFRIQSMFNVQGAFAHNEEGKEVSMLVTADQFSVQQVAKFIRDYTNLCNWGFNQLYIFDSVEEAKEHYKYVKEVNECKVGKIQF